MRGYTGLIGTHLLPLAKRVRRCWIGCSGTTKAQACQDLMEHWCLCPRWNHFYVVMNWEANKQKKKTLLWRTPSSLTKMKRAASHIEKSNVFWRKVSCSDETGWAIWLHNDNKLRSNGESYKLKKWSYHQTRWWWLHTGMDFIKNRSTVTDEHLPTSHPAPPMSED